jgi:hypothetical protein
MVMACRMLIRGEKYVFYLEKLSGRYNFGYVGFHGTTVLKWIFKEHSVRIWNRRTNKWDIRGSREEKKCIKEGRVFPVEISTDITLVPVIVASWWELTNSIQLSRS